MEAMEDTTAVMAAWVTLINKYLKKTTVPFGAVLFYIVKIWHLLVIASVIRQQGGSMPASERRR